MSTAPDIPTPPPPRPRARPRTVLLWVLAAIALALALSAVAPWILPLRIYEGPLVQAAAPDGATLVWYLTRPGRCSLTVEVEGAKRDVPVTAAGARCEAQVAGLHRGRTYAYEIHAGRRSLTRGLTLQTNRPAGERFSFLVFGDSGKGSRAQYRLGEVMAATQPPPDFLLHTGDVVYPDGARRRYEERFFAPYRPLLARVSFWPCLGNHDVDDDGAAEPYCEVFTLPQNGPPGLPPEHHYWFEYGAARIAVVDTNVSAATLRDHVAPWLRDLLSTEPPPRWRFVSLHHPPYTGGKYLPNAAVQAHLVPIFEAHGVDVVFCGHDHSYQRIGPLSGGAAAPAGEGVLYIITAAGGASLYQPRGPLPGYVAVFDNTHFSFTQVIVDGDELRLRQIDVDGHTLDEFTLVKPAPT